MDKKTLQEGQDFYNQYGQMVSREFTDELFAFAHDAVDNKPIEVKQKPKANVVKVVANAPEAEDKVVEE